MKSSPKALESLGAGQSQERLQTFHFLSQRLYLCRYATTITFAVKCSRHVEIEALYLEIYFEAVLALSCEVFYKPARPTASAHGWGDSLLSKVGDLVIEYIFIEWMSAIGVARSKYSFTAKTLEKWGQTLLFLMCSIHFATALLCL